MMPTVAATPQEAQAHTEEQMLAMALRMSSLEANGQERLLVEEQEQQELAIALSLSMAEADGIRALRDPMDSSDDDSEPTPPSTPYGGKYVHRLATICEGASARASYEAASSLLPQTHASRLHRQPVLNYPLPWAACCFSFLWLLQANFSALRHQAAAWVDQAGR